MFDELIKKAHEVLDTNWKGEFTVPTNTLYPFQWNWDSGFVSLGNGHKNLDRSIKEINSLLSGQWANGMVPHILFHSENEKTYFPNFDFWESSVNSGSPDKPKSSGITNPPVIGFVLENLLIQHPDDENLVAFVKESFNKVVNFHRFLYNSRDPHHEGLMYMYHPWESGRDNSPLWDESLNRIEIKEGSLPNYQRRDLDVSEADERPTAAQYDRYVYLLLFGKENQYDSPKIAEECPFLIQDNMMNAILIRSNDSLIRIGERFSFDTSEIKEWQQQSITSFNSKFWNEKLKMYVPYDLRAQKQIEYKEIGSYVSLFAQVASGQQAAHLQDHLVHLHNNGYYLCPSFDVDSPEFDSKRYWRGPIWPHVNWMIYHGLMEYGYREIANVVKADTLKIVNKWGLCEYYEPQKEVAKDLSLGYGGKNFSWTASTILDLMYNT
ncbi:MGH1-like glycoside hydrolase domain-containing protein [Reichenbachiella versicolor]|uniref:MGH1-like glycoside hydrolase domain-containing protein n=1 Tax=Reichenbachiella versicolor TaxID=1821036 RepID=UPI000D6E7808|nr:trehalase family glycosidase [Reichenbachiella versicolor]